MAEATTTIGIILEAQDRASSVIRGVEQQTQSLWSKLATGAAQGIGFAITNQAFNTLGDVVGFAGDAIVGFNARMEQSRIAWATLLGGADQANAMLSRLQQFAATTPFEFPEVERAGKRLLAMGFSAESIIPTLTTVGNTAAALGLGGEGIDRITLAIGQMSTRTKVSAQDMNQLTEVGVPAWRILAEATGKSVGEVQKASEEGKISSDTFINAFNKFAAANYGGLMEAQSHTFLGAVSNIADQMRIVGSTAFEPLFQGLSGLIQRFADFTQSPGFTEMGANLAALQESIGDFIANIMSSGPIMDVVKAAALGLATVFATELIASLASATIAMVQFTAAMIVANLPMILLGIAAAALALIIITNWEAVSDATGRLVEFMTARWAELSNWFSGTLWPAIVEGAKAGWDLFSSIPGIAINFIANLWTTFASWFGIQTGSMFTDLQQMAAAGWEGFVNIAAGAVGLVLNVWNAFVTKLQEAKDAGVELPGVFDQLAGKTVDVDAITGGLSDKLREIPAAAGEAFEGVKKFILEDTPNAIGTTIERLQAAGSDLGGFKDQLISDLQSKAGEIMGRFQGVGDIAGSALGKQATQAAAKETKPLVEELNKLFAQLNAQPASRALEDAKAQIERSKLVLADRADTTPEERTAARRTIRDLTRNTLPSLELDAFDAERNVKLAGRPLEDATLRNQILKNIRDQREQAGIATGAGGGIATPTGGPAVGSSAVGPGVARSNDASGTKAAAMVQLHLIISMEGQEDQIFDELIEANGQAQIPPVIQLSGIRRN